MNTLMWTMRLLLKLKFMDLPTGLSVQRRLSHLSSRRPPSGACRRGVVGCAEGWTVRYLSLPWLAGWSEAVMPSTARALSIMSLIAWRDRSDSPAARKAISRISSSFNAATRSGGIASRLASASSKKYIGDTPKKTASADRCFWVGLSRRPVRSCQT